MTWLLTEPRPSGSGSFTKTFSGRSVSLFACAATLFALCLPVCAENVWPDQWREHVRQKTSAVVPADAQLWVEYSGEAAEKAVYESTVGRFSATAYRLKDSTTALAWYEFLRPESAVPVRGWPWACTTPGTQYDLYQNYVFVFEGWRPLGKEMDALYKVLPKLRSGGGLPVLMQHLPETGRVRNSERYMIGLRSLDLFASQIPAALAGFENGAEATVARYKTPMGDLPLVLVEYPTPQIARDRMAAFEKQPGWQVKRSGPLVAIVPAQPELKLDAAGAKPLFDSIQWDLQFTWYESAKRTPQVNVAGMVLGALKLTGVLLLAMFLGGVFFASIGVWIRRRGLKDGEEPGMITLNLNG